MLVSKIKKFLDKKFSADEIDVGDRVISYFEKFGYLNIKKGVASDAELITAIKRFHEMAGLSQNETITPKTIKAMSAPRCLMKDFFTDSEEAGTLSKWGVRDLTYFIDGYDTDISKEEWEESIRIALSYGEAVCDVKFSKVENKSVANFVISLGQGSRDDFDGNSGVLAWCQLPPSSSFKGQLLSKFDKDETWVPYNKTTRGIFLVNVACHEIVGHGLGVSHHNVLNSLMNPFYSPTIDKPQTEDIRQLVLRYGLPQNVNPPQPPITPPIVPPSTDKTIITLTGNFSKIEIPGYRVQKIG